MNTNECNKLMGQFVAEGYCVVEVETLKQISNCLLKPFNRLIMRAEKLGSSNKAQVRYSESVNMTGHGWSWGCDHIFMPELLEQSLLDVASFAPIPQIIKSLLGPHVRFSAGHGHWTPTSYDYRLHWHRDTRRKNWQFGNLDSRAHVQVCVALIDESVVCLIPGSHTQNLTTKELKWFLENPYGYHSSQIVPKVPGGSALLLNTYTMHRAECSKNNFRRAIHFGFTRADAALEEGRLPKAQIWMALPEFQAKQTEFLRNAINEELACCAKAAAIHCSQPMSLGASKSEFFGPTQ